MRRRAVELSAADRERLEYAQGRPSVDPTANLFGADSVTWRVSREGVLLLGGGRALLLQIAHPLVAAGVAAHSDFQRDPLRRLWRTLELTFTIVFADAASAIRAVRAIEHVHARVRGTLDRGVGSFPKGTAYDASDPRLLFWVHATLVDTALLVYERFVGRLSPRMRATYYRESQVTARLFGVPRSVIPSTLGEFRDYMDEMIGGERLTIGPAGRAIADAVLRPRAPLGLREAMAPVRFLTVGLLPAAVRARYGFAWDRPHQALLDAATRASRFLVPLLPRLVRDFPHVRRA